MKYITASGAQTIVDKADGILIQNNAALTGTITVTDAGTTVAIITDPAVGSLFMYRGFNGAIAVNPSTTCNITVSVLS